MKDFAFQIIRAVKRARLPILTVALTYLLSVTTGAVMVHSGNALALSTRDNIVGRAQSSSIQTTFAQGSRVQAALLDFSGNLFGGVTDTISGLAVIAPYPIIAYRG